MPSLPSPSRRGVVEPDSVISMGQIEMLDILTEDLAI